MTKTISLNTIVLMFICWSSSSLPCLREHVYPHFMLQIYTLQIESSDNLMHDTLD